MPTTDSSMFSEYSHNDDYTLALTFRNGKKLAYADVPPEIYDDFHAAESKGKFYNQHIKGKFDQVGPPAASAYEAPYATIEQVLNDPPPPLPPAPEPEILSPDQAVSALAPKGAKVDELTQRLHALAAVQIFVLDAPSLKRAEDHLVELAGLRKAVLEIVDPYREIAFRAYQAVQQLNKSRLDPVDVAVTSLKSSINAYVFAEQQKARAEQKRLQDIADAEAAKEQQRRTEELRLQVAAEHVEAGDTAQAELTLTDSTIQAAPVQYYAPRVEAPKSALGGRENWKGWVTNMDDLILDVAAGIESLRRTGKLMGHAPASTLKADDSGINALAKANKEHFSFPGLAAMNDPVLTTKKRGA